MQVYFTGPMYFLRLLSHTAGSSQITILREEIYERVTDDTCINTRGRDPIYENQKRKSIK